MIQVVLAPPMSLNLGAERRTQGLETLEAVPCTGAPSRLSPSAGLREKQIHLFIHPYVRPMHVDGTPMAVVGNQQELHVGRSHTSGLPMVRPPLIRSRSRPVQTARDGCASAYSHGFKVRCMRIPGNFPSTWLARRIHAEGEMHLPNCRLRFARACLATVRY